MKIYSNIIIGDINYTIKIGKNAKENWNLIDNSELFDLWFHLDDCPSAHVVISQDIKINYDIFYSNQIILLASEYCKANSKIKNKGKNKIIYTEIKNLKKGKEIGSVLVSNPKYIFI
jgi:predicted ribosome quality control (RQC) complex YloA/Tae2 family protein